MSFGSFVVISLLSICNHATQNQTCFSLFHTLNACKNLIKVSYIYILISQMYKQLKYQQFILHWVDTLR